MPEAARWRYALYPGLLVVCGALYAWRISGLAPVEPFSSHLSNAYLTGAALVLVAGPAGFLDPSRRRRVLVAAAVLLAVNVIGEVLLPVLGVADDVDAALGGVNTGDPVDGLVGVLTVLVVLALLPRVSPPARPGP